MLVCLVAAAATLDCGTTAESNGGSDNLPSRRIVPFEVRVDEEGDSIAVLVDEERDLSEPSALSDASGVALYVSASESDRTVVWRAFAVDGETFDEAIEVLAPEQVWEGRSVEAPAAVAHEGQIWLWYLGGERGGDFAAVLGLARSGDGVTFDREAPPVLFPDAGERFVSPSVIRLPDRFVLFMEVAPDDTEDDPPPSVVVRYDSSDGIDWERRGTVLEPGRGCVDSDGDDTPCWDSGFVRQPGARYSRSPANRDLIDIWYTGGLGPNRNIGFAGSFDGIEFSRYRQNPIVGDGGSSGASVVDVSGGLNLYFADEADGRSGIFVALNREP